MPMTLAQMQALKADIIAAADAVCVALEADPTHPDKAFAVALLYNDPAAPAFTVWKKSVPLAEIARKLNGAELGGLTTANHTRLQTVVTLVNAAGGADPSLADQRAFWDDIFSGAAGTVTRPALLALWKRLATRAQKLFSTGTGSDASPATTAANVPDTFALTYQEVLAAMQS